MGGQRNILERGSLMSECGGMKEWKDFLRNICSILFTIILINLKTNDSELHLVDERMILTSMIAI